MKNDMKNNNEKEYKGLTIRFPIQEWKALKMRAFEEDVSMSELIRKAVKQLLEGENGNTK